MNILMISGDVLALDKQSAIYARLALQARAAGHLTVFVPAPNNMCTMLNNHGEVQGFKGSKIRAVWSMMQKSGYHQFDVVTAQDPFFLGLVAWFIARRTGSLLQLQVHTDALSPAYAAASFGNRVRFFIARFLLPHADSIRVVSGPIAAHLRAAGITIPITVLPIFIDEESINTAIPVDLAHGFPQFHKRILVAARLEKEKRIEVLLFAMKTVLKEIPDAGLFVAGDGSEREALEKLARNLGITSHVIFLGYRNDIFSLYKAVDLVLAATATYEGFGAAAIEARLAGAQVLSEPVGAAEREMGIIHTIFNPESIAQKTIDILRCKVSNTLSPKVLDQRAWIAAWLHSMPHKKHNFHHE